MCKRASILVGSTQVGFVFPDVGGFCMTVNIMKGLKQVLRIVWTCFFLAIFFLVFECTSAPPYEWAIGKGIRFCSLGNLSWQPPLHLRSQTGQTLSFEGLRRKVISYWHEAEANQVMRTCLDHQCAGILCRRPLMWCWQRHPSAGPACGSAPI